MTYEVACVLCGGNGPELPGVSKEDIAFIDNRSNRLSPCQAYQHLLMDSKSDITIFVHDDVRVNDPDWLYGPPYGVLPAFDGDEPTVAVGLGGATALGNADLYRKPYNIWNLARHGYASNQEDAETHGERFTGVRRVAVIEQYFMAIRTDWLRSIGGWPVKHLTHHCLDMWLACEAARADKKIWMVGVACNHYGGKSSTAPSYAKASWLKGGSMEKDHEIPHQWIYENYRDVLPLEVSDGR